MHSINKKIKYPLCLMMLLSTLVISCEQAFISPDPNSTPESNFEYLWNDVKNRYSYFEFKGIDWDSVYNVYHPAINQNMSDKELFDILAQMLFELHDGHVNLTSPFNRSRNWDFFLDHRPNFNKYLIDKNYLGKDYRITGPFHNQVIDSVLYVYYASFADEFTNDRLDELMERADGLKGVIIDIRNNGGGRLNNAHRLAACFADQSYVYAHERVKTGPGKNDFSEWMEKTVYSRNGEQFNGNVVVICNRTSYSASTFFAQIMKVLPNATLIGEQTGGGGGIPVFAELPNGWTYRFSGTQTTTPQGEHLEPGVMVDISLKLDPEDEQNGIDTLIEHALKMLN